MVEKARLNCVFAVKIPVESFPEMCEKMAKWEKNPVCVLNELCDRHKFVHPKYEDCSTEFEDFYEYSCEAFGTKTCGTGNNPRDAKFNSARKMLDVVQDRFQISLDPSHLQKEPKNFVNYVGALLEECVRKGMAKPTFDFVTYQGKDGKSKFKTTCHVGKVSVSEVENSKQCGKHAAARAMIEHLKQLQKQEIQEEAKNANSACAPCASKATHRIEPCFYPQYLASARKLLDNAPQSVNKKALVEDVCRTLGIPSQTLYYSDGNENVDVFRMNVMYLQSFCGQGEAVYEQALEQLRELTKIDEEDAEAV